MAANDRKTAASRGGQAHRTQNTGKAGGPAKNPQALDRELAERIADHSREQAAAGDAGSAVFTEAPQQPIPSSEIPSADQHSSGHRPLRAIVVFLLALGGLAAVLLFGRRSRR